VLCEPSNRDGVGVSESRGIEEWLRRLGPLNPATVHRVALNGLAHSRVRNGETVFHHAMCRDYLQVDFVS
jgi:hypothetical protein